jgi:tubulin monoglycylase TTLL15
MINQERNGLKLNLIEINQHPIMHATPKLKKFKSKFENILYNTFNLVGVGSYWKKDHFKFNSTDEKMMLMGQGSVEVMPEICANHPCTETCEPQCELCKKCLSDEQLKDLELAYLETMNMGEFKRIFPLPNVSLLKVIKLSLRVL